MAFLKYKGNMFLGQKQERNAKLCKEQMIGPSGLEVLNRQKLPGLKIHHQERGHQ